MNDILRLNLEQISLYNHPVVDKIALHNELVNNISLCETNLQEPNLSYNHTPIHSQKGAEIEAQEIFSKSEDSPSYFHIIYGLGLGYLFKEFVEKSKGKIILFEPDIEILRVTLEVVDFSKELAYKNIFVVSDYEELKNIFSNHFSYGTKVKLHFLDFHNNNFNKELQELTQELTTLTSIFDFNINMEKNYCYEFFNSALDKLEKKITAIPLKKLKDKYKNVPAIIVSGGPSLTKNIDTLRNIQSDAIIFCAGTAYASLVEQGIKPDFLNVIERYDCTEQISRYDTKNVNFISESYTNENFQKYEYQSKLLSLSKETICNSWVAELLDEDTKEYETKGTVSYSALNAARIFGCNPIILLGQDLAFQEGNCYADSSAYSNIKCVFDHATNSYKIVLDDREEYRKKLYEKNPQIPFMEQEAYIDYRLDYLNKNLVTVKGQDDSYLPTERGYALFIEYFKDFAKKYKDTTTLINSSTGGALIPGFDNISLDNVFDKNYVDKPNINEAINSIDYDVDTAKIISKLKEQVIVCSEVLEIIQNTQKNVKNLDIELKRYKRMTVESNQYMKNCLTAYMAIAKEYKQNYTIIANVTLKEDVELSYMLKENSGKHDIDSQMRVLQAIKTYFHNSEIKFNNTKIRLLSIIENLSKAQLASKA